MKFWVFSWDGVNSLQRNGRNTDKTLKGMIYELNTAMLRSNVPIRFYMECAVFPEAKRAATTSIEWYEVPYYSSLYNDLGVLNCLVFNNLIFAAGFYDSILNTVYIGAGSTSEKIRDYDEGGLSNGTFVHEIGHWLGLNHTHNWASTPCLQEQVTRGTINSFCPPFINFTQCEFRGDALCDTAADPDLADYKGGPNLPGCTWVVGPHDARGDQFRPDPKNYMSYAYSECKSIFTWQQRAVMLDNILPQQIKCFNNFGTQSGEQFDTFEPDNSAAEASLIRLDIETQTHTFSNIGSCNDEDDWVKFVAPAGLATDVYLELESVTGHNNPVLDVEFWSGGSSIIPNATSRTTLTTVQIIGNKKIYRIPCGTLIANNVYTFRMVRNGGQTGMYTLALKQQIGSTLPYNISILPSPDNVNCIGTPRTYTLVLPNGAPVAITSIRWIAGPNTVLSGANGGPNNYSIMATTTAMWAGSLSVEVTTASSCYLTAYASLNTAIYSLSGYNIDIVADTNAPLCQVGDQKSYSYVFPAVLPSGTGAITNINNIPTLVLSSNLVLVGLPTATGFTVQIAPNITSPITSISVERNHFSACLGANTGIGRLSGVIGAPIMLSPTFFVLDYCSVFSALVQFGGDVTEITVGGVSNPTTNGTTTITTAGTYRISASNACGISRNYKVTVAENLFACKTVGQVPEAPKTPIINIFPNPSGGQVTVENILAGSKITIYDNLGRVMLTSASSEGSSTNIDISSLKAGIYILEAILPNNQKTRKNIVRE